MNPTLKQLAELDEKATQGEWSVIGHSRLSPVSENGIKRKEDAQFIAALVSAYHSGGRELMEDGERCRHLLKSAYLAGDGWRINGAYPSRDKYALNLKGKAAKADLIASIDAARAQDTKEEGK